MRAVVEHLHHKHKQRSTKQSFELVGYEDALPVPLSELFFVVGEVFCLAGEEEREHGVDSGEGTQRKEEDFWVTLKQEVQS